MNHSSPLQSINNNAVSNKVGTGSSQFRTASPLYESLLSPSSVVGNSSSSNVISRPNMSLANNFSIPPGTGFSSEVCSQTSELQLFKAHFKSATIRLCCRKKLKLKSIFYPYKEN